MWQIHLSFARVELQRGTGNENREQKNVEWEQNPDLE